MIYTWVRDFLRWRFFVGHYPPPMSGRFGRIWPIGFAWHREDAVYRNGRKWIVFWWDGEGEL